MSDAYHERPQAGNRKPHPTEPVYPRFYYQPHHFYPDLGGRLNVDDGNQRQ